jgi:hypothetical protein
MSQSHYGVPCWYNTKRVIRRYAEAVIFITGWLVVVFCVTLVLLHK